MNIIQTEIPGVIIIEPRIFEDARGYLFESFSQREFDEKVGPVIFVQDNESKSSYGVMRGLHFQRPPSPRPSSSAASTVPSSTSLSTYVVAVQPSASMSP